MNKFNDDFDKFIYEKFEENNITPKYITDTILNTNLKMNSKKVAFSKMDLIKKAAIYLTSIITISGGVVFAKDVIKNLFNDNLGVQTAVENNYVHVVPEEIYCESNGATSRAKEMIMDDYTLDINMMIRLDKEIDITAFEKLRIPDLKIYDDMNNVLFKNKNAIINDETEKYINTSCSIFIDNADTNVIHYTINISADDEKLPKSKELYIDFNTIEVEKDNKKYIVSGEWNNQIKVPKEFYNRTSQVLKYVSCNNEKVYEDSVKAEVTETCTKFNFSMYWGNYKEEVEKAEERRKENINSSLLIKNNAYIETDNGTKYYAAQTSDVDGGYGLDTNGHLNCWQTFNLTKFDLKDVKTMKVVLETWNNEIIVMEFKI